MNVRDFLLPVCAINTNFAVISFSPDKRKHRSQNDLIKYLDKYQIELETEHLSFGAFNLMMEAGIPYPSGKRVTGKSPRGRSKKPGPKCSKKKQAEQSDEMSESDNEDSDEGKKVNGDTEVVEIDSDDEDKEEANDTSKKARNTHTLRVDVHAY